ncbi:MAG TPA: PD-(D/E)XK nuclease family protein, partial [Gemmatimonadales bacterium]|nr:PD-(D/E)XK nuclease family protein [Gemmatimonadales bacterium]
MSPASGEPLAGLPPRLMERLHQVVAADPAELLELAAEGFLRVAASTDLFPSPPYLLVLRQGGLRDDLFRLAASRGVPGWFDPPVSVFHELPSWLGSTKRRPLGDFERAALVEHVLRRAGGAVFRGREGVFLSAVERLLGELASEGVTARRFEEAVAAVRDRETFEVERDQALVAVYRAYLDELDSRQLRDGRDTLADTAAAIRADPDALARRLGGRREIRIVGLADLRGGWRLLLEALVDSPAIGRVGLYLTEPTGLRVPPAVGLVAARDEDTELEAVALRVRALLDSGVRPDSVAIVARDGRPYVDVALRALKAVGVSATARRRIVLTAVPVVRAVIALLDAAASGWTRHALAGLGAQPYFAADLDVRVINYIGYRRRVVGLAAWGAALERLLEEARAVEALVESGESEERRRSLPAAWIERARERFAKFAAAASPMDEVKTLAGWLEWFDQWLERDPWRIEERAARVPDERWQVVRLDLMAWRQLRRVVADWAEAERSWPGDGAPMTAAAFVERLRLMLAGDVAMWTETDRGVVVAEALAASYRSFDHLFLVGMNAGRFPRRAPSSLLLSEHDREALRRAGMPLETRSEWEAREWELFRTLVAGARLSLTVSYRRLDDLGGAANSSAFVEELRQRCGLEVLAAETPPVCRSAEVAAHAWRVAHIERERATGRPSLWNGLIAQASLQGWLAEKFGDGFVWSPTSLESFAKCPWAWFSERLLRLKSVQDPDEDMDAQVRGSVLHDA